MLKLSQQVVHIAVCDDDQSVLSEMQVIIENEMAAKELRFVLDTYLSPYDLLSSNSAQIDILFLDVNMPGMDGFIVAEAINKKHSDIRIIFLTIYKEFVQKGFRARAFRYLYKPIQKGEIVEALCDALDECFNNGAVIVYDVTTDAAIPLKFKKIVYIESIGDFTVVYLSAGKIMSKYTMRNWCDLLDDAFYRCHKSYIINLDFVSEVKSRYAVTTFNSHVPISVRSHAQLMEKLNLHIKKSASYR